MTSPSTPPPSFDTGGAADSFAATWRRVMTEPRAFFAEMPEAGGLQAPLVFLASCAALNGAGTILAHASVTAGIGAALWGVLQGLFMAGLATLVAQHLFDGPAGFEPVFRAVAYAAAPLVFLWLPGVGVVAQAYAWYLAIRGVEQVQRFDTPKAMLTIAAVVALLWSAGLGHAPHRCRHEAPRHPVAAAPL